MTGFIQLHRKILEWEWYSDHNTKVLFIHCLLKANHKNKKWRGKIISRGSFLTGREVLSNEIGVSQQSIRTSLNKLKSTNEITIKSTSAGTLVSIVNYDDYQGVAAKNNQRLTNKSTNDQPTTNQRLTTTNNDNNDNKLSKDNMHRPADVSIQVWNDFVSHRKKVKAQLTQTALNGIIKQAEKANWSLEDALTETCTRGWRSFKAEWVQTKQEQKGNSADDELSRFLDEM